MALRYIKMALHDSDNFHYTKLHNIIFCKLNFLDKVEEKDI